MVVVGDSSEKFRRQASQNLGNYTLFMWGPAGQQRVFRVPRPCGLGRGRLLNSVSALASAENDRPRNSTVLLHFMMPLVCPQGSKETQLFAT